MGALSEVTLDKILEQSLWPLVIVIDFTYSSLYYVYCIPVEPQCNAESNHLTGFENKAEVSKRPPIVI
jgi:hypothetical protein